MPVQHPAASCRMLETFESSSDREPSLPSCPLRFCDTRSMPLAVLEKQSQQLDRVESIEFALFTLDMQSMQSRAEYGLVR